MAHKITVPVNRVRRALAAAVAWSAGGERRSAGVLSVEHGTDRTGPADLDLALALTLALALADVTRAGHVGSARPAEDARSAQAAWSDQADRPTQAGRPVELARTARLVRTVAPRRDRATGKPAGRARAVRAGARARG
ncbi:hypothetical protein [Streptomyces sp. MST-110588]|uniref:hypothetical protein n=1 Tax=Streptomyces sp. MST-110588 TaxID=2833628 RepID=UPI001F5CADF8|nr:hypothetical protein [Streptomyces sp. MST-110588]UNO40505.1 hypothetical protein KGS77_14130 [Streptomyces sp. MST-110588]